MIKSFIFFAILGLTTSIYAQDLDISLFDDVPNLGHNSTPLDSVRITPPPAPDIRIKLDNSKPAPPVVEPVPTIPTLPSIAIDLSNVTPTQPTKPKPKRRLKDVLAFDVGNFSLGESATSIFQRAQKYGFKVLGTQENIPLFYATEYDHRCRNNKVIVPDAISKCIQDYACREKTRYIAEATLQRKNEYLTLYFTSNSNGNVLYKIVYLNKGDNSVNFTRVNKMKKQQRQAEFWNAVFDKYGYPDDDQKYIWGDPARAYMKAYITGSAYDAYIILEDLRLSGEDYFNAKDIEADRPPRNLFGF